MFHRDGPPLLCFRLIFDVINFTVFTHWKNIKDVELSEISFVPGKIKILVEFYLAQFCKKFFLIFK